MSQHWCEPVLNAIDSHIYLGMFQCMSHKCSGELHWELREEPSKSHTNPLIQPVKIHLISRLVIKRVLELMASTLGSTCQKVKIRDRTPLLASSPSQVLLMKDLVWKTSSKLCEKMEVEMSSNVKFFQLYPRGKEAKSWNNIGAFIYVRSQSTAEIFLAHNHMGGIHITSVTPGGGGLPLALVRSNGGTSTSGANFLLVPVLTYLGWQ